MVDWERNMHFEGFGGLQYLHACVNLVIERLKCHKIM